MTGTWAAAILAVVLSVLVVGAGVTGSIRAARRVGARRADVAGRTGHATRADHVPPIVFSVPTAAPLFLDGLRTSMPTRADTPVLMPRLYLAGRDDGTLTYAVGTRIRTAFTYLVVTASCGTGCVGQAGVARWSDRNDVARAHDDLALIDAHVRATIESLGGTYGLEPAADGG